MKRGFVSDGDGEIASEGRSEQRGGNRIGSGGGGGNALLTTLLEEWSGSPAASDLTAA